ncbi:MAG: anthranilate phosphoribosyltransferase [Gammaproteobacteria bacterium]|nr:anthranilate phosphoribosyltransferase [Gammaproteobacteria bacterium]
MNATLECLYRREDLAPVELEGLFAKLVAGKLDPVLLAALLVALKLKGESGAEIAAAARALRAASRPFSRPDYDFADCCGTGGDGLGTLNVSTGAAFAAAACGLPIVKHGNRSVSSQSGSADVLEGLGVNIHARPETARRCLDEAGICFLLAPDYHPGIAHAMPVRKALATRTLFNVLGPLVNPARPPCQLVGVYAPELVQPVAEALALLDLQSALVVHGDGLDEIALHGPTRAARVVQGQVEMLVLTPEDAGLPRYPLDALRGGAARDNAAALMAVLEGEGHDAYKAAIAFNTGALLWVSGLAGDIGDGTDRARCALEDGLALARLQRLREVSHGA